MALLSLQGDPLRPPKKKKERREEPAPIPPPTGPFKVFLRTEAQQQMEELPDNIQEGVQNVLDRLKEWPQVSGARPLFGKGWAPNKFRMKTGDWRIEFIVNPAVREITVVRIGHRDGFYDEYH